ncbi:hypothetical protein [Bythopirellula goksoeyrii]|uniref:Uncharacterized protein n=1 Tax=Bythopirellula goksoeyrii TaxID=1400387 RepID=A0A5B9QB25_9BACT|nr:hypothetical protein [Bythopirellula goksoeyrii]QEG34106.1 hypothetical protein Pr1d_13780 [Bythopirellula goksoeyrii]
MAYHLVNIGEVIVNGIVFDPKNGERLRTMDVSKLLQSIPRLFDLLEEREVEYVLVGGIAMLVNVEGRNTQAIDLIVARKDLEKLPEIRIEESNVEFARGWLEELRVDYFFPKNKLFEKVRHNYTVNQEFANRTIPCATVEGLLLLKLFALPSLYRQARFDRVRTYQKDIADLIARDHPATAPLMKELSKHMIPSDILELENILKQIEDEIAPSQQRFRDEE